ncbi:MAG: tyrosine-type recombinase/integrase [Deltaproteobacteria bacterium]|nr:tyrosine-type recombinase/integrase [Deltaproteobacteria bacterium]
MLLKKSAAGTGTDSDGGIQLPGLQSHVTGQDGLRHAFASMMVNSGASLPIVGKILGHTQASTTQRYAHLEENPARKAAEEAAARIVKAMQSSPKRGKVVDFKQSFG